MTDPEERNAGGSGWRRMLRRPSWRFAAAVAAILVAALVANAIYRGQMARALLTIQSENLNDRPDLVRFAASIAAPTFAKDCARCHGADMKGDRVLGAANLVDKDWLYGDTLQQIEQTILYGIRSGDPKTHKLADMPAFAHPADKRLPLLSTQEVSDLTEYVVYLSGRSADPAAVTRGAPLYANKGGCYDCHTPDGQGDQAIGAPNLTDAVWLRGDGSRHDIFNAIAEGLAGVCPAWKTKLSPLTVRALAVYIQSKALQSPSAPGASGKRRID